MPEKRMSFNAWSMQGLLAWRKTQTRRLVNGPPRYAVGDSIVILEKWRVECWHEPTCFVRIEYEIDDRCRWADEKCGIEWLTRMIATSKKFLSTRHKTVEIDTWGRSCPPETCPLPWRSPRFLPTLCACPERLTVTAVHAEPLHAITPAGCIAEGVPADDPDPLGAYRGVWETIHGPGSWRKSPTVYVYAFENSLAERRAGQKGLLDE